MLQSQWITPFRNNGENPFINIQCREVHSTHTETHNTISGNPLYKARLEIPWDSLMMALSRLLGAPERWPFNGLHFPFGQFYNIVAVSAEVINDAGSYVTNSGYEEVIHYDEAALIDVTYMPRIGKYITVPEKVVSDGEGDPVTFPPMDVYIEDRVQPRYESIPEHHRNLIWGDTTDVVPTDKKMLHPDEVPSRGNPGLTLIHTIEGYDRSISELDALVGTVTNADYTPTTKGRKKFPSGTLFLRTYEVEDRYTFRSYRIKKDPPPPTPGFDVYGLSTPVLKLVYEYKKEGWEKFWRNNSSPTVNASGYYYIRYSQPPYAKYVRFQPADHSAFLFE